MTSMPGQEGGADWALALERCFLAGFVASVAWIVAGSLPSRPAAEATTQPVVGDRLVGPLPAARGRSGEAVPVTRQDARVPPAASRAALSMPPSARVAPEPPPLTFIVDPFADGEPTVTVAVPERVAPAPTRRDTEDEH